MFYYLMEIFESVNDNGFKYYHLSDSKTFTSEKEVKDLSYYKVISILFYLKLII